MRVETMGHADLINIVRNLDHTGPGENGEHLQLLWSHLAASLQSPFHATEGSALRWLLKSMLGHTQGAETLRRYPLTWTILRRIIQRIPLFSLAKSLADRKFINVLQQALNDIAQPAHKTSSPGSAKRKMNLPLNYSLESLKTRQGQLQATDAVFGMLAALLDRVKSAKVENAGDAIGAEHIKSLFCLPATEAVKIPAPALAIAGHSIAKPDGSSELDAEQWVETISFLWNFHLTGNDDADEVAQHLFRPSAIVFSTLGELSTHQVTEVPGKLRGHWSSTLQRFMQQAMIRPGKAAYFKTGVVTPFVQSLELTKACLDISAPALAFLCFSEFKAAEGGFRKTHIAWIVQILKVIEDAVMQRPDRNDILSSVLDLALQYSVPLDVDFLRRQSREYALQPSAFDWPFLTRAARCEPDILQLSDDGHSLKRDICDQLHHRCLEIASLSEKKLCTTSKKKAFDKADPRSAPGIIAAILTGFRTRRDLSGFLRLWFEQLCRDESAGFQSYSLWFAKEWRQAPNDSFADFLEKDLSPPQLVELLSWLEGTHSSDSKHAVSVFLATIADALHSEPFTEAVGRRLFEVLARSGSIGKKQPLEWRVVSKSFLWTAADDRRTIWRTVQKAMRLVLEHSPIASANTFEAFKCCSIIWDASAPNGSIFDDVAASMIAFLDRLCTEYAQQSETNFRDSRLRNLDNTADFQENTAFQHYLAWFLSGSSRFLKLYAESHGELPLFVQAGLNIIKADGEHLGLLLHALIRNDVNLNSPQVVGSLMASTLRSLEHFPAIGAFDAQPKKDWLKYVKVLSRLPLEAFSRAQRESIMKIILQGKEACGIFFELDPDAARLLLGLMTKMMTRSTFYSGMGSSDLVNIAAAMSKMVSEDSMSLSEVALLELLDSFSHFACASIRPMAERTENRSVEYFNEAWIFVRENETRLKERKDNLPDPKLFDQPFELILLDTLWRVLSQTAVAGAKHIGSPLKESAALCLATHAVLIMQAFMGDRVLLKANNTKANMSLLATLEVAVRFQNEIQNLGNFGKLKVDTLCKFERRARRLCERGHIKGWKLRAFLHRAFPEALKSSRPTAFESLKGIPTHLRTDLPQKLVSAIMDSLEDMEKFQYLKALLEEYCNGYDTDGQLVAIQFVVDHLIDAQKVQESTDQFDLATAHVKLTLSLLQEPAHAPTVCRIIHTLMEGRPQAMTQWNIELMLSTTCELASREQGQSHVPYPWLCKLVEVVIKKHRIRLEGRSHLLLSTLQSLLQKLITKPSTSKPGSEASQELAARLFARLITLICEPTAGAVARAQLHSTLDSATDAAKRAAGRYMYLILMQYVKLQLDDNVPRRVREELDKAMYSIFDITPPEVRKILNDALSSNGRAILREMYKRYVRFGKWAGV